MQDKILKDYRPGLRQVEFEQAALRRIDLRKESERG